MHVFVVWSTWADRLNTDMCVLICNETDTHIPHRMILECDTFRVQLKPPSNLNAITKSHCVWAILVDKLSSRSVSRTHNAIRGWRHIEGLCVTWSEAHRPAPSITTAPLPHSWRHTHRRFPYSTHMPPYFRPMRKTHPNCHVHSTHSQVPQHILGCLVLSCLTFRNGMTTISAVNIIQITPHLYVGSNSMWYIGWRQPRHWAVTVDARIIRCEEGGVSRWVLGRSTCFVPIARNRSLQSNSAGDASD